MVVDEENQLCRSRNQMNNELTSVQDLDGLLPIPSIQVSMENPESRVSSSSKTILSIDNRGPSNKPSKVISRSREKLNASKSPSSTPRIQSTFKPPENWANAPEFVPRWLAAPVPGKANEVESEAPTTSPNTSDAPKPRSYADVVGHAHATDSNSPSVVGGSAANYWEGWCPYYLCGECRYGDQCALIHGVKCDYCGECCLHPYDTTQRDKHLKECVAEHEKDMELSFAVARSIEKTCGICYEKVLSKEPASEQRFGILPSCTHCYCLSCIRRWRQARQFENKIIRACPECRVTSDFVCPSRYWVDSKEDKEKLIGCYKIALSQKNCRYYRNGEGQCPFGNKCFYRHALPSGQEVDVGPPRRIMGAEGRVAGGTQNVSLFEFIEEWEVNWMNIEELIDILDLEDLDIVDDTFDYWM